MEAMSYEYLIRRAYNCGRHGVKGADADIYRRMEMAQRHLDDPNWGKTKEEKEHDFLSAFVQVRTYVQNAIRKGFSKIEYKLSDEESTNLNQMQAMLSRIDFYDKARLDEIIKQASNIFRKHELEAD